MGVVHKILRGLPRDVTREPTYFRLLLERCLALVFADILETPVVALRAREHGGSSISAQRWGAAMVFGRGFEHGGSEGKPTRMRENYTRK